MKRQAKGWYSLVDTETGETIIRFRIGDMLFKVSKDGTMVKFLCTTDENGKVMLKVVD